MANYRDYGIIGLGSPREVSTNTITRRQVYLATHKGEQVLPYMNRSFISFSYGGKNIEDFDLIATTPGSTLDFDGYAGFNDLTSSYDVLDGQFFWGSHYTTNTIEFELATDGIDLRKLDSFLHWFSAGKVRELILAEHPNRAIMARVAEPPRLKLLPFEQKISVKVYDLYHSTSTTLYKGSIALKLVADEPHWYAKLNIFGYRDELGIYRDNWFDPTVNRYRSVLEIPDAIKILHEDGIPLSSMIKDTMLLGGNVFATVEKLPFQNIVITITAEEYAAHSDEEGYYNSPVEYVYDGETYSSDYFRGAVIATTDANGAYVRGGRIGGARMSEATGIEYIGPYRTSNDAISIYYPGTAPSPVILSFTLTPRLNYGNYVVSPRNLYATDSSGLRYNTITLEGKEKKEFKFTTPNILTSYNEVIRIFNSDLIHSGQDWATIRETIRESVWHSAVRAWANRVIDFFDTSNGSGQVNTSSYVLANYMSFFLKDSSGAMMPMRFTFNSRTGEAVGTVKYRNCIDTSTNLVIPLVLGESFSTYCASNIVTIEENVGDMVKSKYLIIDERNFPTDEGYIVKWSNNTDNAQRLYHDVLDGLTDVLLEYKNMYL